MKGPFDKRKKESITAGDAIRELLDVYHIKGKFSQAEVKSSWERIMGKPISTRTKKLFFKKNVLFVELTSAALKQEMNMSKSKVLQLLQNEFGKSTVEEIIFI